MKPLRGLDGLFLHLETADTPMHVASLHLFEAPPAGFDFHAAVRQMLAERIERAPVLRRKLAGVPLQFANPLWVDDAAMDLDDHVRSLALPLPGDPAQLEDCIAELHARPLERDRPLWRLYVIHGVQGGCAAFYFKIHHAMLDGAAGVALVHALFDREPSPPRTPPARRRPEGAAPGIVALSASALKRDATQMWRLFRSLPGAAHLIAGSLMRRAATADDASLRRNFARGPRTAFNGTITGERSFAALTLPLDALRRLAADHQCTLNDVLMALCSAALRRYLARHGGIPAASLIAAMPISLREAGDAEFTTQATMSLVSLATDIADPRQRLRAICAATGATKRLAKRAEPVLPTDYPSLGVPWILGGLASLYGFAKVANHISPPANLVISNVPGPAAPLYCCGLRMTEYWPISIVEHGLGLNITAMSYAGTLSFGIVGARNALPEARELAAALRESFAELVTLSAPAPAVAKVAPATPRGGRARAR